jgi:hypothetical protein
MSRCYLSTPLRRALEKVIRQAREVAEDGARDAIRRLGVADGKPPSYLGDREKDLRRRLRAHARALGDSLERASDKQEIRKLVEATAYAHWHRMLFARFLTERNLLRHPVLNAPITIDECRELAGEERLPDAWAVAERYAAAMLPAVFRIDDPMLLIELDAAHSQKLTALVNSLDPGIFQADDSLGWTYQFWRVAEKEAVNNSGVKIGADELPAVTQLFTEPYMVRFLLHNTLGAWWAGKRLAADVTLAETAANEDEVRAACRLPGYTFEMLRFVKEDGEGGDTGCWRPAAGAYAGWPRDAKTITMLDPCCGSGHFLTETLAIMAGLRQQEERLSPAEAVAAVLRDNLHGLEIDGRCVQIAAFAVALTAWRIGGWQTLPLPHIAWVGAPPPLPKSDFVGLAGTDADLQRALSAIHDLFAQAPILGSLIEPAGGDLVDPVRIANIELLLRPSLDAVRKGDPIVMEGVIAARGMADALAITARHFTLQVTNVPYLGRGKQCDELASFIDTRYKDARADLSTVMLERMRKFAHPGGTIAAVTPQNWLFLGSYRRMREALLAQIQFNLLCDLGPAAFNDMNWWAARTALLSFTEAPPGTSSSYLAVDADTGRDLESKPTKMAIEPFRILAQADQLSSPDARISVNRTVSGELLSRYADAYVGFQNGDTPRWVHNFWEHPSDAREWHLFQLTSDETRFFDGRHSVLKWESGNGELSRSEQARLQGREAWGRDGVIVRQMRHLPAGLYVGDMYDQASSVIVPKNQAHLPAVAAFAMSTDFHDAVRRIAPSVVVTNATFVKVPFSLPHWQAVAAELYPDGLPEPYTGDATQWIFHGHPANSQAGHALHVALARVCGYRWPAEFRSDMRLAKEAKSWLRRLENLPTSHKDGLLPVPAASGEPALADRVRELLSASFNSDWSDALERRLVAEADEAFDKTNYADVSLESWLRDRAFREHCVLFHQRPFLWHIWDGLSDGFSVFVDYHRFGQAALRKLTYTVLGDWLARAKAEKNDLRYEKARELQQKLEKILEGEAPYDIFVRWKSLGEQPLGWDPQLDDGVRLNIRPFVAAGILRDTPKIKWSKDRGSDLTTAPWYHLGPRYGGKSGDRINDHHTTRTEKRAASAAIEGAVGSKV